MMPGIDGIEVLRQIKADPGLRKPAGHPADRGRRPRAGGRRPEAGRLLLPDQALPPGCARGGGAGCLADAAQRRDLVRRIADSRAVMALIDRGTFRFRTLEDARALAAAFAALCEEPDLAGMGLVELLVNAVEHGNLGITFHGSPSCCRPGAGRKRSVCACMRPENLDKTAELERPARRRLPRLRNSRPRSRLRMGALPVARRDPRLPSQRARHRARPQHRIPHPRVPRLRQRSRGVGAGAAPGAGRRPRATGPRLLSGDGPGRPRHRRLSAREAEDLGQAAALMDGMQRQPACPDPGAGVGRASPRMVSSGDAVAARRTALGTAGRAAGRRHRPRPRGSRQPAACVAGVLRRWPSRTCGPVRWHGRSPAAWGRRVGPVASSPRLSSTSIRTAGVWPSGTAACRAACGCASNGRSRPTRCCSRHLPLGILGGREVRRELHAFC